MEANVAGCQRKLGTGVVVRANQRDQWGRSVDESMIVLRLRIREMKMMEMNQELPSDWMKWEKQYFAHYHEDVFEAVGLLQSYLMSVRPSVAFGMVALLALSVPMSSGMVLIQVLEMAKRILPCFGLF
ncbi:hypothetical protein L6164_007814 [Bauhinia variegata]|uniref:Uncharacterized protein n=1 Tax=Bauhinia variegata TaxID=167791 RepID=A0ACB9PK78_BAUVA|nr:hypothetical protein L6164_007814 [Bauhinia variegata]